MKKITLLILSLSLLSFLFGCAYSRSGFKEPVEFFYQRREADLKARPDDGVIASEMREASGHKDDLNYLLSLYLRGPLDGSLVSPFPAGCKLTGVSREGKTLHVILDEDFAELKDMDLTVACACLAETCMALTDVDEVHMEAVSSDAASTVNLTIRRDTLLLEEPSVAAQETEPTT